MRLNGGEFLLNLLVLGALTISSESVEIDDESVIEQLTGLKEYIDNQKSIKPLFIKFNNGSEIIVAKGEVRKFIYNTDFILYARTKTSSIEINVTFTQRVDANENPINDYYIAEGDATLTFTNEVQIFENIVDKDGHARFIEGVGVISALPEGYSEVYNRYSLSGTHLMLVFAFKAPNETSAITTDSIAIRYNLPKWIMDKIIVEGSGFAVDYRPDIQGITSGATGAPLKFALSKLDSGDDTYLAIRKYYTDTPTANAYYRVQFDLLIDNESSEDAGE